MREQFWRDVFLYELRDAITERAAELADRALAEYDKRFNPVTDAAAKITRAVMPANEDPLGPKKYRS